MSTLPGKKKPFFNHCKPNSTSTESPKVNPSEDVRRALHPGIEDECVDDEVDPVFEANVIGVVVKRIVDAGWTGSCAGLEQLAVAQKDDEEIERFLNRDGSYHVARPRFASGVAVLQASRKNSRSSMEPCTANIPKAPGLGHPHPAPRQGPCSMALALPRPTVQRDGRTCPTA